MRAIRQHNRQQGLFHLVFEQETVALGQIAGQELRGDGYFDVDLLMDTMRHRDWNRLALAKETAVVRSLAL